MNYYFDDPAFSNLIEKKEKCFTTFKNATFLITGSTGLIGRCICFFLLFLNKNYNYNIKIIANFRNLNKFKEIFGNLSADLIPLCCDISKLSENFDYSFDLNYIIHCACITDSSTFLDYPFKTIDTVLIGTRSVLQVCLRYPDCKALNLSTQEVYGVPSPSRNLLSDPWHEDELGFIDLFNQRNSYPLSKRFSEHLCFCSRISDCIKISSVRLAQCFGVGVSIDDSRVFAQFARNVLNKEDIVLLTPGTLTREFIDVYDAASGLLFILKSGFNKFCYNLSNPSTFSSIRDLADKFATYGTKTKVRVSLDANASRKFTSTSITRLNPAETFNTGWAPLFSIDDSISNLLRWFKYLIRLS